MGLDEFKLGTLLGKGSFGAVYRAKRRTDGMEYAIKEMSIRELSSRERDDALNEIRILASINHPHIVKYCEAFVERNNLYIVMEFAEEGDLHRRIKKMKQRSRHFDEEYIWNTVVQIVKAIKSLHDRSIMHRDLKPKNIFIAEGERMQLGDLGCSKLLKSSLTRTQVGTPYYMSPELWKNRDYDGRSDMWAVGCIAYELAALQPPFTASDMKGLSKRVCTQPTPPLPRRYSRDLADLVHRLLAKSPSQRPSAAEVLGMPTVQRRLQALEARGAVQGTPAAPAGRPGRILSTIKAPRNFGKQPVAAGEGGPLRLPRAAYPVRRLHTSPSRRAAPSVASSAAGARSPSSAASSPSSRGRPRQRSASRDVRLPRLQPRKDRSRSRSRDRPQKPVSARSAASNARAHGKAGRPRRPLAQNGVAVPAGRGGMGRFGHQPGRRYI